MRNTLSAAFCSGSALLEMGKGQRGKSCSVISQARQLGKVVRHVTGIDDTSSIMVDWDNGSGLNCLYGIDRVRKVD